MLPPDRYAAARASVASLEITCQLLCSCTAGEVICLDCNVRLVVMRGQHWVRAHDLPVSLRRAVQLLTVVLSCAVLLGVCTDRVHTCIKHCQQSGGCSTLAIHAPSRLGYLPLLIILHAF